MRKYINSRKIFYITGGILLGIVVLAFIVSLFWTPYDPNMTDAASKFLPPSAEHLMGTDNFGRDLFSRVLSASKYTIYISFSGVSIALLIGTLTGLPAGYFGGISDRSIMLLMNLILGVNGLIWSQLVADSINALIAMLIFFKVSNKICSAGKT